MPESLPIADAQHSGPSGSTVKFSALRLAVLHFLEPGVLPVLALALIVGGWSYGYKLSHYLHNPGVTKASATRMWLDQRHASVAAPVPDHQLPQKFLTLALCVFAVPALPHVSREQIVAELPQSHAAEFVSPLHPLRAPPISLLA